MSVEVGGDGLEIITAGEPSSLPPLLFVHGAFCGAWVWTEHFLPFFAQRGWRCVAVSLRGHGRSAGRERLDWAGLADYVADVATAAAGLDRSPVVIGHSMGGLVAQRFACKHGAAALALLAPSSLAGLAGSAVNMALFQPALLSALGRLQSHNVAAADFDAIRYGLFSENFPIEAAQRFLPMFQRESLLANLELVAPQWFHIALRPRMPVLVLGGAEDRFIPLADLRLSALPWSAELQILDGVPHALMLDSSWRRPAEMLDDWLKKNFGEVQRSSNQAHEGAGAT
jgi:pimeloyl-ACP methyl ester carboxylesterase